MWGLAGSWEPAAVDATPVEISNAELRVKLYLPNAYYHGTRFDHSGVIADLDYKGHHYYEHWYNRIDPQVHDFKFEGAEIIASTCSGITGPVEEFQTNHNALGFDEAKVGGTFIKIGVGVLRKDSPAYDFVKQYEVVDPGKWRVDRNRDSIVFTQELNDPATGYGYTYRKTVRLVAGKPEMVLENSLKNTGRRPIQTSVYNHNFLALDQQPTGPDFSISFPFQLHSPQPPNKALAEIRGNHFVYLKTLAPEEVVFAPLEGFSENPKDHEIRIENYRVGAGMLIRGNRPLSHVNLWSIRSVLAVEPFITMTIDPGSEFDWEASYEYYTLATNQK
jgi:hypothetical protein